VAADVATAAAAGSGSSRPSGSIADPGSPCKSLGKAARGSVLAGNFAPTAAAAGGGGSASGGAVGDSSSDCGGASLARMVIQVSKGRHFSVGGIACYRPGMVYVFQ
jgi:hypothetical protein